MFSHKAGRVQPFAATRLALLFLLLISAPAWAEEGNDTTDMTDSKPRLFKWVDNKINDMERREMIDTSYVVILPQRWKFKVSTLSSLATLYGHSKNDTIETRLDLSTQVLQSVGLNVSYRGFSAGYSVVIYNGRKDNEFVLNLYGNRFGVDFLYRYSRSYEGQFDLNNRGTDHKIDIEDGKFSSERIGADAYYVFKSSKFSYPAAFTQSYIQKRSAGSVISGVSYSHMRLATTLADSVSTSAKISALYLGAGYAYNFCPSKWLLHVSTICFVSVYTHDKERLAGHDIKKEDWEMFSNLHLMARMAAVRHWEKWFFGFSCVINQYSSGSTKNLRLEDTGLRMEMSVGLKIP